MWWIVLIAAVILTLWWCSNLAGRLHQVHIRRDDLLISLRWQLVQRENLISKLLEDNTFGDAISSLLSECVEKANWAADGQLEDYLLAESKVSQELRKVFSRDVAIESTSQFAIMQELAECCYRIELARRFHNDAVGAATLLHKRILVRIFRLAGNTKLPVALDMDDVPSDKLSNILQGFD
jgi:hypothetical protein